jgi:hypothetical protein
MTVHTVNSLPGMNKMTYTAGHFAKMRFMRIAVFVNRWLSFLLKLFKRAVTGKTCIITRRGCK